LVKKKKNKSIPFRVLRALQKNYPLVDNKAFAILFDNKDKDLMFDEVMEKISSLNPQVQEDTL